MQVTYFSNSPLVNLSYYFIKWLLKRNLATILPLKSKLPGKFQRFNAIDGSIEILKNSQISKPSIKVKNFKTFLQRGLNSESP